MMHAGTLPPHISCLLDGLDGDAGTVPPDMIYMSCLLIGRDDGCRHSTPRYKLTPPSLESGLLVCRDRRSFDQPAAWLGTAAPQKRLGPCKLDNIPQH